MYHYRTLAAAVQIFPAVENPSRTLACHQERGWGEWKLANRCCPCTAAGFFHMDNHWPVAVATTRTLFFGLFCMGAWGAPFCNLVFRHSDGWIWSSGHSHRTSALVTQVSVRSCFHWKECGHVQKVNIFKLSQAGHSWNCTRWDWESYPIPFPFSFHRSDGFMVMIPGLPEATVLLNQHFCLDQGCNHTGWDRVRPSQNRPWYLHTCMILCVSLRSLIDALVEIPGINLTLRDIGKPPACWKTSLKNVAKGYQIARQWRATPVRPLRF